ncbi:spore germination protein [Gorillibacterium sp. CAU 1737]|uniref:spore germination protein n=1 Tax=Gorillibacterium sp. CAU 1737 TaxID=3140362 RepID=UPI003260E712
MWSKAVNYVPEWKTWVEAGLTLLAPLVMRRLSTTLRTWVGKRSPQEPQASTAPPSDPLTGDFQAEKARLKQQLGRNSDVHFREFELAGSQTPAMLVFVEGMQNEDLICNQVLKMLMQEPLCTEGELDQLSGQHLGSYLQDRLLPLPGIPEVTELLELKRSILSGYTALLIEGLPRAFLVGTPSPRTRAITEPTSEALLRGSRVGFTEMISENTAMLRQQGRTDDMVIESFEVGSRIQRTLAIAYMSEIVNPDLLKEVKDRIAAINMDFLAESGYIEQLIEDNPLSPFQQVQNTERPDRTISALLEGRVAILLEGSPFALLVPVTFTMLIQSPEDYFERWLPGSLLRMLRFLAAFLSLMTPSLYISFISFHPGLLPTELAITIAETRQGVPFPSLIEILILEISIEILREAGIRLPKPIGPAMGIVGGLIIGEAAVQAGIVSPMLVIIVAVTAISSFAIPMYSAGITLRMLRFIAMLFASVLGMLGTILFFLLLCSHMTKLKSFGVPYVTPVSPFRFNDWKDLFIRAPLPLMRHRPNMMKTEDKKRRS